MPLNRQILPLGFIATLFFLPPIPGGTVCADEKVVAAKTAKTLPMSPDSGWKPCHFGGDGPIEWKDGVLALGFGDPLTGVRWEAEFPKNNYEVTLESRRVGGFDFFCGLTLPAEKERFSLILGGWGGSLVGLSSIDGNDASSNETMMIRDFEKNQWYKVRVRVTDEKIICWLDEEEIINVDREGRVFDIRVEMEECTPMGLAAFQCESEFRNMVVRSLLPEDIASENNTAQTKQDAVNPTSPAADKK